MKVEIISVDVENKGKWQMANVAYKGPDGKVEGKKVVSFVNKDVFKLVAQAKQGDILEVKSGKNEKGHWEWIEATVAGKNTGAAEASTGFKQASQTARGGYETPEERAKRQVYIVRQSSVSAAVALAELNKAKAPVTEADIIKSAKAFEAYVFDTGEAIVVNEAEVS